MRAPAAVAKPILCLLTLVACVRVDYIPMNPPPHPLTARAPTTVEMFQRTRPDRPFVEVATIEVVAMSAEKAMVRLREEGGKHGCDGLLLTSQTDMVIVASSNDQAGYRATCIVFGGSGSAPMAPPSGAASPSGPGP